MGWHFSAQSIGLHVRFVLPNIRRPVSCHNARSQRSVLLTERTCHNIAARAPTAPRDAIYDVIAASRKHVFALIFLRSRSALAVAVFGRESVWECLTPVWCVQKQSTARHCRCTITVTRTVLHLPATAQCSHSELLLLRPSEIIANSVIATPRRIRLNRKVGAGHYVDTPRPAS